MAKHRWNYSGDINLECGGLFWREDGAEDYVLAVEVMPASDLGGPDNVFLIESGSIYMPKENAERALDIIGSAPDKATRRDYVEAWRAYHGIDKSAMGGETTIQIGKAEDGRHGWGFNPEPDYILRGNSSLKRYVRREFLD